MSRVTDDTTASSQNITEHHHGPLMEPLTRRLLVALSVVNAVIALGGLGLWILGHGRWTLSEALYMAVISVSTVGFAELPGIEQVPGARALTAVVILLGLGALAYFQSSLTAFIVEGSFGHAWRRKRMKKQIDALSGHVVVAGVGSTGRHVVEELHATGTPFVAIDRNHEHLERTSKEITGGTMLFVHGDAIDDNTLLAAGVDRASAVIAALTHDRDNLYVTLSARTLNPRARIVTKVVEPEAEAKMLRAGANVTVSPNIIGGRRMANEAVRPGVLHFLDQVLREREHALSFRDMTVSPDSTCAGKPISSLPIRLEGNVLIVAVRGPEQKFLLNPGPDYVLTPGTVVLAMGETEALVRLQTLLSGERHGT